ncbi:hypothetical protein ACO0QE_002359 [Hanseniaspora vineae]
MKVPPLPRKSKKLKAKRVLRRIGNALQLEPLKNRWKFHKVHKYNRHNKWSFLRKHSRRIAETPKPKRAFWRRGGCGIRSKKTKNLPLMIVHMRVSSRNYQNKVEQNNSNLVYLEKTNVFKLHLSKHQYKLKPLFLASPTQKILDSPSFTPEKLQKKELLVKSQFENLVDVKLNYYGPNVLKTICIPILNPTSPVSRGAILSAQFVESKKTITFGTDQSVQVSRMKLSLEETLTNNAYHRRKLRQKYLSTKQSVQGFLQQVNQEMENALTGSMNGTRGDLAQLTVNEPIAEDTPQKKLGVFDFYRKGKDIITGYTELAETINKKRKHK